MDAYRMKSPRILTNADIALAMELYNAGVQYQHIAAGLGVCTKTLRANLKHAEEHGYRKEAEAVCSRVRRTFVNRRSSALLASRTRRVSRMGAGVCREVAT